MEFFRRYDFRIILVFGSQIGNTLQRGFGYNNRQRQSQSLKVWFVTINVARTLLFKKPFNLNHIDISPSPWKVIISAIEGSQLLDKFSVDSLLQTLLFLFQGSGTSVQFLAERLQHFTNSINRFASNGGQYIGNLFNNLIANTKISPLLLN